MKNLKFAFFVTSMILSGIFIFGINAIRAESIPCQFQCQTTASETQGNEVASSTQQDPMRASPINKFDLISGKPVNKDIMSIYQNYFIGHCCRISQSEWEYLPTAQKDALIQRSLQTSVSFMKPGTMSADPINEFDPTSGKPIVLGIKSIYQGYVIGHCCTVSKDDWEYLPPAQKDAIIKKLLQ
ncbi:MAG: hypothetical protein ACD_39C00263G0002 [uncultured bacterium]|nr:MAG: hypothetical protein ACD_39C00263G0002 [uncultured bacterium]